jgi:hypothetical protein
MGCHSIRRAPFGTPCLGVWSASGRSATVRTTFPASSQTSSVCGKAWYGTRYENGRLSLTTKRYFPSGDGSTDSWSPGDLTEVRFPVARSSRTT